MIEVFHQPDAQQAGRTNGNFGIGGKIKIDLQRKAGGSQHNGRAARLRQCIDLVHNRSQLVRQNYLFEIAPRQPPATLPQIFPSGKAQLV